MRVLHINMTYDLGSTGRFARYIVDEVERSGGAGFAICGDAKDKSDSHVYLTQSKWSNYFQIAKGRLLGNHGLGCKRQTKKAIKVIENFKPDVIHLHNLHGDYINFQILFEYLKQNNIPIVWKLPDCWAFTGHCTYFDYVDCSSWLTGCGNCPQKDQYPVSWLFDRSKIMLEKKKEAFSNVKSIVIAPPSEWLANECSKSFLGKYEIFVVNNGIDLTSFRPVDSNAYKSLKREGEILILGVMFCFDKKKGLDYFNYLAKALPERYSLAIVGFEDKENYLDKRIRLYPRTNNTDELAVYYSAADVFVNPTLEENFPSVNIEALACGTPIVAFETGGATEAFDDNTGISVPRGDAEKLLNAVLYVGDEHPFCSEDCVKRAHLYSKENMVENYLELYRKVIANAK